MKEIDNQNQLSQNAMKTIQSISTLACLLLFIQANAQKYSSCETALEICSKESLKFEFNRDAINGYDQQVAKCLTLDYPTSWIKWEIAEDGIFSFTISPETYAEDIDFAVYRLNDADECSNKILMRCMMCGMNLGDLQSSIKCLGPTGLSIKEPNSDLRGERGCNYGTNNFLAALDCKKGERYALAIQNFDNSAGGFFIDFCGDAKLPCDSTSCMEFSGNGKYQAFRELAIMPISTSRDSLPIFISVAELAPISVEIRDENQGLVKQQTLMPIENRETYQIYIPDFPNKKYNVELKLKKRIAKGSFLLDRILKP